MISSIPSNGSSPDYNSLFSALGGNSLALGSAFSQAMSQAKTPGQAAKVQWLQAEYSNLMDLSSMGSGGSSIAGLGMSDMFGIGGPMGVPSWAADVERLMGNDSNIQQLLTAQQQASFAMQSQFNQSLADFGSTGGSVNSLI